MKFSEEVSQSCFNHIMSPEESIQLAMSEEGIQFEMLSVTPDELEFCFEVDMKGSNLTADMCIQLINKNSIVIIYSYLHQWIEKSDYLFASELVAKINQDLPIGNFDFDFSNGQFSYKLTSVYDVDLPFSETLFLTNLYHCFHMMDNYSGYFMCVGYEDNDDNLTSVDKYRLIDGTYDKSERSWVTRIRE